MLARITANISPRIPENLVENNFCARLERPDQPIMSQRFSDPHKGPAGPASKESRPAAEMPDGADPGLSGSRNDDLRRAFMEHSVDGIVILDVDTAGVIDANSAFADMLGYTLGEVRRLKVWDWDAHWSREDLERMFAAGNWPAQRLETRHRRKDGQVVEVAISITEIVWKEKAVSFCVVKDISERKRQELKLQQELARWQMLMKLSNDGIVIQDWTNKSVIDVNPAFAGMLGYEEGEMIGMHPWDWDAQFSREEIEAMSATHKTDEDRFFETLHRRKDGTLRNVEISSTRMTMGEQNLTICICRDITARNQADELLRAREREFRTLAENTPDAIVRYDRQLRRLYVNPTFERLVGKNKNELLGKPLEHLQNVDLTDYRSALETAFRTARQQEMEFCHLKPDGSPCWAHIRFEPEFDENGAVDSVLVVLRDISDMVEQRDLARQLAFTDTLTGLPNRALFKKRFQEASGRAIASGDSFALLMLDLDHFKDVNDTLGHQTGDELLRQVTMRLSRFIRECDTIARLGGDEFAILVNRIGKTDDGTEVATRVLDALTRPFDINGQELLVSGSIGIAFYPGDSGELNELFTFADTALYSAKRKGRNNFQCYSPELTRHATERMSLGAALRHACVNDELQLLYQPKVLLENGRIIGGEALVRWHHPELGLLSPDRFITIAEESGSIIDIGRWVMENACRAAVRFNRHSTIPFKIAVNLSCRQFVLHDLAGEVRAILHATGCLGQWLEFEITESLMIEDNLQVRKTLEALRALGISIAIDDFGTGYSALSYLTRFSMDVLKIDRSFINGIDTDPRKAGLVNAFIAVGKTLGMEIVAEGVETAAQAAVLELLGCELAQGYLFGRPQTLEDFTANLPAAPLPNPPLLEEGA
jgi:diguanylate cyclase (GGDEF)-like protein/PAS domain S-box-containing protein